MHTLYVLSQTAVYDCSQQLKVSERLLGRGRRAASRERLKEREIEIDVHLVADFGKASLKLAQRSRLIYPIFIFILLIPSQDRFYTQP